MSTHEKNSHDSSDRRSDVHADDGFPHHTAEPDLPTLGESLKVSITAKLMCFKTDPSLSEKMAEIAGLLHYFFSLSLQERITIDKAWVKKILNALEVEEQPSSEISDKQYADYAFELAKFIRDRQLMIADPTPPSLADQFIAVDRRLRDRPQNGGDLKQSPRNRRSTDRKTPPTALANTNRADENLEEETKGPRTLLYSLWSKIMPKKSDQASQVDPQQAEPSSNDDEPQDESNSPGLQ